MVPEHYSDFSAADSCVTIKDSASHVFDQDLQKIKFEDDNVDDDVANHNNHEPVLCHNFWNDAPEDLLMEIFIRHPDCRSAARTSTVCRQWHSLIFRNPLFIQRFKSHHHQYQDRYPPVIPWTIMFRKTYYQRPIPEAQHFQTVCQLYSQEWMFLYGKLPANHLDFLPSPMMIKASCNDLLLVSPGLSFTDDLYICNPVTKQFVQLPTIPRLEDPSMYEVKKIRYALVPMPPSGATTNTQFKVVEVLGPYDKPDSRRVQVSVFCSESRKWEIGDFPGPRPRTWWKNWWYDTCYSNIIRCNEILYWMGTSWESESIVYLDLSKEKCGAINIPSCNDYQIGILHVIGGGVDELRLIQRLSLGTTKIVHLKVWRLNNNNHNNDDEDDDDSNWFLVHDKILKTPKNLSQELPPRGAFVHPTNGDLVFIIWGTTVIEYNLINESYKKIAELTENADLFIFTPFLIVLSSCSSNLANV